MASIAHLSTRYNAKEDRLQLVVELASGETRIFWFTRRLMGKLVPPLLKWLEGASSMSGQSGASSAAVQRFSQTVAMDSLRAQESTSSGRAHPKEKPGRGILVTKITLRRDKRVTSLDLKADDAAMQSLPFREEALRQWLAVVYSQYKSARWSDDIWPSWIEPQEDRGTVALLH